VSEFASRGREKRKGQKRLSKKADFGGRKTEELTRRGVWDKCKVVGRHLEAAWVLRRQERRGRKGEGIAAACLRFARKKKEGG